MAYQGNEIKLRQVIFSYFQKMWNLGVKALNKTNKGTYYNNKRNNQH